MPWKKRKNKRIWRTHNYINYMPWKKPKNRRIWRTHNYRNYMPLKMGEKERIWRTHNYRNYMPDGWKSLFLFWYFSLTIDTIIFIYPFITVAHNLIQITLRIKYRVNLLVINTFPLPNSLSPYDSSSTQSYLTVDNLTSYPYYKLYPICLRPQRFQLREDSKVHIR